jgi:hypothetical protein
MLEQDLSEERRQVRRARQHRPPRRGWAPPRELPRARPPVSVSRGPSLSRLSAGSQLILHRLSGGVLRARGPTLGSGVLRRARREGARAAPALREGPPGRGRPASEGSAALPPQK